MMTFSEAKTLVARSRNPSRCLRELRDALGGAELNEVLPGPGRMNARDALGTFEIRSKTAGAAGIEILGFEETLAALEPMPSTSPLLLFHFSSASRTFTLFVDESAQRLIGCICSRRRNRSDT
ncbi:MAG: hypothetical protein IT381_03010 [Deltaproteobacteria bacterium]|nr:hypothetical protein [Deltaproteobacteria bacterium]